MESTAPPSIAKRLWRIVQVIYYMLRKGMSKRKLFLDLHFLLKRGKLAGKALGNLLTAFHHHHRRRPHSFPTEVEFSCSNTPSCKRDSRRRIHREYDRFDAADIAKAFEFLNVESSPGPSGFQTPSPFMGLDSSPLMARQLRITDSPFPALSNEEADDSCTINKEAEEFIRMFREQLRRQQSALLS